MDLIPMTGPNGQAPWTCPRCKMEWSVRRTCPCEIGRLPLQGFRTDESFGLGAPPATPELPRHLTEQAQSPESVGNALERTIATGQQEIAQLRQQVKALSETQTQTLAGLNRMLQPLQQFFREHGSEVSLVELIPQTVASLRHLLDQSRTTPPEQELVQLRQAVVTLTQVVQQLQTQLQPVPEYPTYLPSDAQQAALERQLLSQQQREWRG